MRSTETKTTVHVKYRMWLYTIIMTVYIAEQLVTSIDMNSYLVYMINNTII